MTEWRRNPRVKEDIAVRWGIDRLGSQGDGIIRNISISGLMLEVDERFNPADEGPINLQVIDPARAHLVPSEVKLVWYSRVMAGKMRQFCGMKFTNATGPVYTRLVEHVEERLAVLHEGTDINIIQHYLSQSN